jgi:hypothetical protein
VHDWVVYHREVLQTPLRTLAAQIGISKSAVDKFHRNGARPGKNWPRLRDWYMATRATKPSEYRTPPELMVASVLQSLSDLPRSERAAALRSSVEYHRSLRSGRPTPEWIEMLAELAEGEGN